MNKLLVIIKNYLKLIFRNKVMIIVVPIATVLVVAALANAFHTLLDTNDDVADFKMGYEMPADSKYAFMENIMMSSFEEQGVETVEYEKADPEEIISKGDIDVFVTFEKDSYHIYGDDKKELQVRIVQYVLFNVDKRMDTMFVGSSANNVKISSLETIKTSEAENYYGIIEIVYFLSLCTVFLSFIFQTERQNSIGIRFRVGNAGSFTRYMSKYISCLVIAILIQVVLVSGVVLSLFDVTMGNPVVFFGILILTAIAFTAYGLVFFLLFNNMAVSIGLLFMTLWFAGFVGGTFETYMYTVITEPIKRLSPLYYVNRTLVETSVNGSSSYLGSCIVVLSVLTVVCMLLGIIITSRKKEV
ncbi:MAG: ABC transporter permease [Saccharofermentans sp.]|nr:ABC transporter permease [Saccharofermentans sp.]